MLVRWNWITLCRIVELLGVKGDISGDEDRKMAIEDKVCTVRRYLHKGLGLVVLGTLTTKSSFFLDRLMDISIFFLFHYMCASLPISTRCPRKRASLSSCTVDMNLQKSEYSYIPADFLPNKETLCMHCYMGPVEVPPYVSACYEALQTLTGSWVGKVYGMYIRRRWIVDSIGLSASLGKAAGTSLGRKLWKMGSKKSRVQFI